MGQISYAYTPSTGAIDDYSGVDDYPSESFVKDVDTDPFHIGQRYMDIPARKLVCVKCGGDHFNVGIDEYYTAIRCVNCGWELCVHDG